MTAGGPGLILPIKEKPGGAMPGIIRKPGKTLFFIGPAKAAAGLQKVVKRFANHERTTEPETGEGERGGENPAEPQSRKTVQAVTQINAFSNAPDAGRGELPEPQAAGFCAGLPKQAAAPGADRRGSGAHFPAERTKS